ncbi:MAG: hypothetical protein ABI467_20285 [Kofleriaceae bacterium]
MRAAVIAWGASAGCVGLGVGSQAPGAGAGEHWGTTYHHTLNGETAPPGYDFAVHGYHSNGPVGMEVGYRGGFSSASIPNAPSSVGVSAELHLDVMAHGFGLTASYGKESATFNSVDYTYGGLGTGVFTQMTLAEPLYLDLGVSRIWGGVGVDGMDTVDAPATRISARLKLVVESFGLSAEIRGTSADHAMVGTTDATWSSMSMMFELFYVAL